MTCAYTVVGCGLGKIDAVAYLPAEGDIPQRTHEIALISGGMTDDDSEKDFYEGFAFLKATAKIAF